LLYTKNALSGGGYRSPWQAHVARALARRGYSCIFVPQVAKGAWRGIPSDGVISSPCRSLQFIFSAANYFPLPPGKERVSSRTRGLPQYNDRQYGGKLYRFQRIPRAPQYEPCIVPFGGTAGCVPGLTTRGVIGENACLHAGGGVAQLGEHHVRNVGVEGSIPFSSTTFPLDAHTTRLGASSCLVPLRLSRNLARTGER
jgi:hypothetical protein